MKLARLRRGSSIGLQLKPISRTNYLECDGVVCISNGVALSIEDVGGIITYFFI